MKHRGQGGALASGSRYEGDVTILHDLQKWPQLGRNVPLAVEEGAIHVGDDQSEIVGGGRKRGARPQQQRAPSRSSHGGRDSYPEMINAW